VYSFHTLFTRYVHFARFVPKGLAKMGIIAYLQAFCQGTDQIVTPSKMAKRVLLAWKVKKPIAAISFGVDLSLLPSDPSTVRKALRSKWGLSEKDKVLLYAGRLSKEKNIPFLLEAFSRLNRADARLVLIGGGPLKKELRQKNLKHVLLIGEVGYPEVLSYYCAGDIFVFSSLSETQGLVLAEAKAAGLPIVALFAGGLVETVRSGTDGYLTERNLSAFTEHIARLLDDDDLRLKMGVLAREDALDRFSSFNVAKKFETLYNSLIHKKG
jgi:glycosyltransferase involved in cell wall biosynthesis